MSTKSKAPKPKPTKPSAAPPPTAPAAPVAGADPSPPAAPDASTRTSEDVSRMADPPMGPPAFDPRPRDRGSWNPWSVVHARAPGALEAIAAGEFDDVLHTLHDMAIRHGSFELIQALRDRAAVGGVELAAPPPPTPPPDVKPWKPPSRSPSR